MTNPSPIESRCAHAGPPMMPYALGEESSGGGQSPMLVAAHAPVAFEYAALRRSAGLIDMPHRATVEITGSDRVEFLQRMLTQDLVGHGAGVNACRDSFWCNRKGRIDADVRLMLLDESVLVDLDIHAAARFISTLGAYLIADDCDLTLASDRWHRLGLHGPASRMLLETAGELLAGDPGKPDSVTRWRIGTGAHKAEIIADHRRLTGELGYELSVPTEQVGAVVDALFAAGGWDEGEDPYAGFDESEPQQAARERKLRPIGWHAFNTARIEAGTALYYLDFGPEHLPHESGVVDQRVRFDKGCYLGQEIVARMQSIGHAKQTLVALDLSAQDTPASETPQPVEGAIVLADVDGARESVGVVTSSSISPMLGGQPICFAMVRWKHAQPGSEVGVTAEGSVLKGVVREKLAYWTSK